MARFLNYLLITSKLTKKLTESVTKMDIPLDESAIKGKRKQRLIRVALAIVTLTAFWFWLSGSFTKSVERSDIRTSKVFSGNLKTTLQATGEVVPLIEETVTSRINSQIRKVLAQPGQKVSKGQVLMHLDAKQVAIELENMDEEIALKTNQIETRKLNLVRTQNASKGRMELLQVDLDSRKTRLERLSQLFKTGGTSAHDLKEAKLNVQRTEIEIRQLKQSMIDDKASTLAEIEGIKLERSMLEKSRGEKVRQVESTSLKAPIDGVITWINNEEGTATNIGDALVKVADTDNYKVEVSISEFYAGQIWQGMPAEFESANQMFSGQIDSFYAGDTQGVLKLSMKLAPKSLVNQKQLRQKQRLEVQLITGEIENTLLIEKGPFVNGSGITNVYVISDDTATKNSITLGASNREYYQVKDGLREGAEVIISDTRPFNDADKIRIDS